MKTLNIIKYFSVFVLLNCFMKHAIAGNPEIKSKYACQHNSLRIQCGRNEQINIHSANYGRTNVATCGLGSVTNCFESATYDIVKTECENQQTCTVAASNDLFGDPCPIEVKYLEVDYICVKGKE